jgi:plastocyanin
VISSIQFSGEETMQVKTPAIMLGLALLGVSTVPPKATVAPTVHEVRMTSDGKTFSFSPAALTIKEGDQVKFINMAGGPHNVAFDPARVPDPAAQKLAAAMKDQIAPLAGPLLTDANQAYVVSFAGVPAGKYEFFCMPHAALAMKGVVTVE